MNSITELLDLEDADIFISNISISGTQKFSRLKLNLKHISAPFADLRCIPVG